MPVSAIPRDAYLSRKYSPEVLKKVLLPKAAWKPYPTLNDRPAWDALPESIRKIHVERGEAMLDAAWPQLSAILYLQYARNGNRTRYQDPYQERRDILSALVLAECIENKGRFLDAITNAIWGICEETSWCYPAHIAAQAAGVGLPDTSDAVVDLFAAETGALMAWTVYLLGSRLDTVSPLILPRIQREVNHRILSSYLAHNDYGWMGFVTANHRPNNWNPWINSNVLTCTLVFEESSDRRVELISKVLRSLDCFITPYPRDGGCDEGPSYWGHAGGSLYEDFELLFTASDGKINEFSDPLVQNIASYEYRAHVADHFFLNFADANAILTPDPVIVYGFGKRVNDPNMIDFGLWLAKSKNYLKEGIWPVEDKRAPNFMRILPTLFGLKEMEGRSGRLPMVRDVWLEEIQVMAARDQQGTASGLYLAAKGGHNNESHNHNDVGHFIAYKDGKPVIIDIGVETYTRKTFSPDRYEIWTMQSTYHSLPTINGIMQGAGQDFAARDVRYTTSDGEASLKMDLAAAYPKEAGIKSWKRSLTLQRGKEIALEDVYDLEKKPETLTLSLMTACKVDASKAGVLKLSQAPLTEGYQSGAGEVHYDPDQFDVSVEEIAITDERLLLSWSSRLYRLLFTVRAPKAQGSWKLSIR